MATRSGSLPHKKYASERSKSSSSTNKKLNDDDQSPDSFTSLVRNHIKLKLNVLPIQFKKRNPSGKLNDQEINERVVNDRCKNMNNSQNVMLNVTFKCQDSQPLLTYSNDKPSYISKNNVSYLERKYPVNYLQVKIRFNYVNSISEFTKLNFGNEDEILNSLITIIDHDDHQVYFKLKTNHFNEENEPLYRYIVLGKMDDTEHAFIFDVSEFNTSRYGTIPKNLKAIYDLCMHKDLAQHFENLKVGSCSNSDKSIRRIGFGMFFRADTIPERFRFRYYYYGNSCTTSTQVGLVGSTGKYGDYGIQILAETKIIEYPPKYIGIIDVGYYKFKLNGWCTFWSSPQLDPSRCYTCKLTQEVKYL